MRARTTVFPWLILPRDVRLRRLPRRPDRRPDRVAQRPRLLRRRPLRFDEPHMRRLQPRQAGLGAEHAQVRRHAGDREDGDRETGADDGSERGLIVRDEKGAVRRSARA
jgi:hypothetical protein